MNDTPATGIWSSEQLTLGEGPLTNHVRASLVWCDIVGQAVYERPFAGGRTRRFELPVMPSALGILDEHRVLVATEVDFRALDLDTGSTETVHPFAEDPAMRSNDGRVHPSGAFWIGTMAKDGSGKAGAIYRLFEGSLSRMIEPVVIPNSICFTADGRFAYYADTPERTIWRIPTDPATGDITGEREVFVTLSADLDGGPDGSVVDGDDNLWNARWGGSALDVYSPDGALLRSHAVPVRQPTCPAFVGPDLDRVVTTSAAIGLDAGDADGTVVILNDVLKGRTEPIVRP